MQPRTPGVGAHPFSASARRDMLTALSAGERFDVLVIGGGITGAGIARDGALRGLRVALVERDDFGSGTSSRSSRLIHGGLRYLEHAQFHLVFESSRERRTLLRIAPHLVRPLAFTWPIYEGARLAPWKVRAGLHLYDALALFRNIARARHLDARTIAAVEPALRPLGLLGGARYYDASTDDARLTLANARAAAESGAVIANHVEVRSLEMRSLVSDGAIAVAVDALSGREMRIEAAVVVNATGPWADGTLRLADPDRASALRGTKGAHIAVPRARIGNEGALTLLSPVDGRVMFVLPWGALTIIGTTDTDYAGDIGAVRATRDDVTYLLRSANAFFPAAHLAPADVVSAWAGIRPLVADGARDPGRASREHAITWVAPAMLSVSGGKLTTYRAMAAEVVDALLRRVGGGRRRTRALTAKIPLPGGDVASLDDEIDAARAATGAPDVAQHLVATYGSEWREVWSLAAGEPALATRVAPPLPYIAAELRYAVEREMAVTLSDLLIRRTHIAFETRDHGRGAAGAAAAVVAPLLDWDAAQVECELARYDADVANLFTID